MERPASSRSNGPVPVPVHFPKYLMCEASASDSDLSLDGWGSNADKALASIRSPTQSEDFSDVISFKCSVWHERSSPSRRAAARKTPQPSKTTSSARQMLDSPLQTDVSSTVTLTPAPTPTTATVELKFPNENADDPSPMRPQQYSGLKAHGKAFTVPRPQSVPEHGGKATQQLTGRNLSSKSPRELIVDSSRRPQTPEAHQSAQPDEQALPYQVHAKAFGWKLTSQTRRKQIMKLATKYQHDYDNVNGLLHGLSPTKQQVAATEEAKERIQDRQLDALRTIASRRQKSAPGISRPASRGSINGTRSSHSAHGSRRTARTTTLYVDQDATTASDLLLAHSSSSPQSAGELEAVTGVSFKSATPRSQRQRDRDIADLVAPADRYAIIDEYLQSARNTATPTGNLREMIASEPFLDNVFGNKQSLQPSS